jgi:ATP-dependent DNA helicase HFM1/MER3
MEYNTKGNNFVRFVAISATIPNVSDLATWLSSSARQTPAAQFRYDAVVLRSDSPVASFGEEYRPIQLNKIVLGFGQGKVEDAGFKFCMNLNYR